MKRVLIGALIVVFALGLAGCKSIGEKVGEGIAEGVAGGGVDVDGDSVTIETEDGAVTVEGDTGKISEGFPSDFPLYDGADVDATSSIASENNMTYYINLVTTDEVSDVYDWYKAELDSEGWELKNDVKLSGSDGDTAMLSIESKRREGTVTLSEGDGGTEIGIILLVKD